MFIEFGLTSGMGSFGHSQEVEKELVALSKAHGNVHTNVSNARVLLNDIQASLADDNDNTELLQKQSEVSKQLESAILEEEALLLQKSRVKWLNVGDINSSFFFNQIRANWNNNKLLAIEDSSGDLVLGHKQVSKVAMDFFSSSLGTAQDMSYFYFNSFSCATLSPTQASILEGPVSNGLILATLKGMKKE